MVICKILLYRKRARCSKQQDADQLEHPFAVEYLDKLTRIKNMESITVFN